MESDLLLQLAFFRLFYEKLNRAGGFGTNTGLIMESPSFPVPPGRYLVTGGRSVTTGLTVQADGSWKLDEGTLYDVTHLPCRSARYNPIDDDNGAAGSPAAARLSDFPVRPGAEMPPIPGTKKQDYAVLFVIGKAK